MPYQKKFHPGSKWDLSEEKKVKSKSLCQKSTKAQYLKSFKALYDDSNEASQMFCFDSIVL